MKKLSYTYKIKICIGFPSLKGALKGKNDKYTLKFRAKHLKQ